MPYMINRTKAALQSVTANGSTKLFTVTPVWSSIKGSLWEVEVAMPTHETAGVTVSIYVFDNPNAAYQFLRDTVVEDASFEWLASYGVRTGETVDNPAPYLVATKTNLSLPDYPEAAVLRGNSHANHNNQPFAITGVPEKNPQGNLIVITTWSGQPKDNTNADIEDVYVKTIFFGGDIT